MDSADWRELRASIPWAALGAAIVALPLFVLLMAMPAHAHDWKKPDLDGWYSSLRNPHSGNAAIQRFGCCSKNDCHTTEAEMRGNEWWARLGNRRYAAGGVVVDWDLQDWVKIPTEAVLPNQDNPTGSAVICHEVDLMGGSNHVDPNSRVWCFIRPSDV